MSRKRFRWAGQEFAEEIEQGRRNVILRLQDPDEEVVSPSGPFLREEMAAMMLQSPVVKEKISARLEAKQMAKAAGK